MIAEKLIAHRGWRNRYPENTLVAVEAAVNAGARHVEIDVQLTADGIPVLCHDHLLQRVCGHDKNIHHCTFDQLKNLSAYEPERLGDRFKSTPLSSLADCVELIARHSQVVLYVELKRQSIRKFGRDTMLNAVLPALEVIRNRCFLISFDCDILQIALHRDWNNIAPVLRSYRQAFTGALKRLSPPLMFCDHDLLDSKHTVTKLPYPVAVYEIGDYRLATSLLAQGAALVETFLIGELIEQDAAGMDINRGNSDEDAL